ncbi:hypothetical protein BJ508DRAFT_301473 [Ascobolus immersus RN42]|uniref:Uncharacterized protein n=1 Tax=Ascobolus immersus RN42 TaxID=1160509 RepID=A0A3N4INS3_ASCIM|nr:hypothetical protein BJ508DRAFT_301473 [Ascobolus immersus RN42]
MLLPSALPCDFLSPGRSRPSTASGPGSIPRPSTPRENIIQTCRSLHQILSLSPACPRTPSRSNARSRLNSAPKTPSPHVSRMSNPPPVKPSTRKSSISSSSSTSRTGGRKRVVSTLARDITASINAPPRMPQPVRSSHKRTRSEFDSDLPCANLFPSSPSTSRSSQLEENLFVTPKRTRLEKRPTGPPPIMRLDFHSTALKGDRKDSGFVSNGGVKRRAISRVPRRRLEDMWGGSERVGDELVEMVVRGLKLAEHDTDGDIF